jgi:predicted alpha/beta-fold hydrolase
MLRNSEGKAKPKSKPRAPNKAIVASTQPTRLVLHLADALSPKTMSLTKQWCDACLQSYEPREYHAPLLLRNGHLNTIVGGLFATPKTPPYRRERFDTPDGDFFTVDFLDSTVQQTSRPRALALLYHGLESTTYTPLTMREAWSLAEAGFDVAAIAFRGCGGDMNQTPKTYHIGFTDDLKFLVETLHKRDPTRRMYLTATSLGGNVMAKYLAELGDDAVKYNVLGEPTLEIFNGW